MSSNDRKIQRVSGLLAEEEKKNNRSDYSPRVVSIGPYHHGKPELALVEAFKPMVVDMFVRSQEEKDTFLHELLEMIGQVRICYEHETVANYSDVDLAQMMLRDACLIITEMEIHLEFGQALQYKKKKLIDHLGRLTVAILFHDFMLVENQIPLAVIKVLIKLHYGGTAEREMINNYVNKCIFGEFRQSVISPRVPLHLLEFMHMVLVSDCVEPERSRCCGLLPATGTTVFRGEASSNRGVSLRPRNPATGNWKKKVTHSFRTVTDLKAKGIHFRPSATHLLKDIKFKSHFFYATLQLPEHFISNYSKAFLKNLIAFELLPGVNTEPVVTSYIDFMKSLIVRPEDVKELREKRILYSQLGSDEEVIDVFKDINTHGTGDDDLFFQVRDLIQAHYNNRIKTWMAELIHTYFRSPWTVIAFLAAVTIIALTAGQFYYAMHPLK